MYRCVEKRVTTMLDNNNKLRPVFHITGGDGWINDPNGLIVFRGKYHVFFQYHPYGTCWGPMHWGHVVSKDLMHWERLPIALTPGDDGDIDGCFSGSAIEHDGKLYLLYTGFTKNDGQDTVRQVQCLAESADGVEFVKRGVVIGTDDIPLGYSATDFRDPKVWKHDGKFWCVIAARKLDGRGRTLVYSSDDLLSWRFVGDMLGEDCNGIMTECPDYRDAEGLFLASEQSQPPEGKVHLNYHTTRWALGKLDYVTGHFTAQNTGICDYGFDFYAPQSFGTEPVVIGWMNMWDRTMPSEKYGFAGMLTVPRKIHIENGDFLQTPIVVKKEAIRKTDVKAVKDNVKIGVAEISADNLREFDLLMRKGKGAFTSFKLAGKEWVFDRSHSGEPITGVETNADSIAGIRRMPFDGKCRTQITIVFDEFSVEIFVNGKSMTSTVYPPQDADGLELKIDADNCEYVRYDIV